jgi:hypothetical protein
LTVNKQAAQKYRGERFHLRKLNEMEVRKHYHIEITNRFAALENSQFAIQKFKDYDIQKYNFASFLYGCETWSLILREFLNRALRRKFGP